MLLTGPAVGLGQIFDNDAGARHSGSSNSADSNSVASTGNAGPVVAGNGSYASSGEHDGLINVDAANGWGGSNIASSSLTGPAVGLGQIFDDDGGARQSSGHPSNDSNSIASTGNAGPVLAGDGTYAASGDHGGLINVSAANGWGGSNIASSSASGPAVGLGQIFDNDTGAAHHSASQHTADSNSIATTGDAAPVLAGEGSFTSIGDHGGLIQAVVADGLGGSNFASSSLTGPAIGLGEIHDNDAGTSHHAAPQHAADSNSIATTGNAAPVLAGEGSFTSSGDHGGLIQIAAADGWGGSNFASSSLTGPAIGIGNIVHGGDTYWAANGYDNHAALTHDDADAYGTDSLHDLASLVHHTVDAIVLDVHHDLLHHHA